MNEEELITEQDLIDAGHQEKVDYLKSKGLIWKSCKFGNHLGGYIKGYLHISARCIMRDSLEKIKRMF